MELAVKDIKYHRGKDQAVPITEPQALLMISDLIATALQQNGFTAVVEAKD